MKMRIKRRFLVCVLAAALCLSFGTGVLAAGQRYEDVPAASWYAGSVSRVTEAGYMNGVSETAFAPDESLSRAMFVTALWRLAGSERAGTVSFADVPVDSWYAQAAAWAYARGIAGGVGSGCFGPDLLITREQMAAFLYRYVQTLSVPAESGELGLTQFSDEKLISSYARTAVGWAAETDILRGTRGELRPRAYSTRAEAAAVLCRFADWKLTAEKRRTAAIIAAVSGGTAEPVAEPTVVTYPGAVSESALEEYTVSVNGKEVFVYSANVQIGRREPISQMGVASFDFGGGPVTVTIKAEASLKNTVIRPTADGIQYELVDEHTLTFKLDKPAKLTIEPDGSGLTVPALALFANPLETDVPDTADEAVLYYEAGTHDIQGDLKAAPEKTVVCFGPGVHRIGEVHLQSGQRYYLAGGAYVYGNFVGDDVENVKIYGRGILNREQDDPEKYPSFVWLNHCRDITLDGLTLLGDAKGWCVTQRWCEALRYRNLKIVVTGPNTDGFDILSCRDVLLEDSFIRNWDDCVTLKAQPTQKGENFNTENVTVKNCVFWADLAQALEIGYETNCERIGDILWQDIDVIHTYHNAAISIHNTGYAVVENVRYEDIRVEAFDPAFGASDLGEEPRLIDFYVGRSQYTADGGSGRVRNIVFSGLTVSTKNGGNPLSVMRGADTEHNIDGVTFLQFTIDGMPVSDALRANLTAANTYHVSFDGKQSMLGFAAYSENFDYTQAGAGKLDAAEGWLMSCSEEGLTDFCARIYAADRSVLESIGYFVSSDGQNWTQAEVNTVLDTQNCYIQKPKQTLAQGSRYLKIVVAKGEGTTAETLRVVRLELEEIQTERNGFDDLQAVRSSENIRIDGSNGDKMENDWARVTRTGNADGVLIFGSDKTKYLDLALTGFVWCMNTENERCLIYTSADAETWTEVETAMTQTDRGTGWLTADITLREKIPAGAHYLKIVLHNTQQSGYDAWGFQLGTMTSTAKIRRTLLDEPRAAGLYACSDNMLLYTEEAEAYNGRLSRIGKCDQLPGWVIGHWTQEVTGFRVELLTADSAAISGILCYMSSDGMTWQEAETAAETIGNGVVLLRNSSALPTGVRYLKILLPDGEKTDAAHIQIGQIEAKLQQTWSDTFDSGFEKLYERSGNSGINTWDGAAFGGDWAVVNRSDSQDITLTYEVEKGKYSGAHASIYLWGEVYRPESGFLRDTSVSVMTSSDGETWRSGTAALTQTCDLENYWTIISADYDALPDETNYVKFVFHCQSDSWHMTVGGISFTAVTYDAIL